MRLLQLALFFIFFNVQGQTSSKAVISSPLEVPINIVSAYGEIRPNHFHSGIDLSTFGKSQRVIAAAEGYISRVRKSAQGYGNVIYIDHPSGITTVYAHLESFTDSLENFVKQAQLKNKRFEFDTILDEAMFLVKSGDFIAMSGNSGSSSAPHLHFEVRDQQFENTINPLLFNFSKNDVTPPVIRSVAFYPKENEGTVNMLNSKLFLPLVLNKKTKKKGLSTKVKMPVLSGWVSFGFQGGDVIEKKSHLSGIYEIKIAVDSQLVYKSRLDQFSFNETRNVNAYFDYATKVKLKRTINHCVVPQNQMIGIFKQHQDQGYFYFNEDKVYSITYTLTDISGNVNIQSVKVKGKTFLGLTSNQELNQNFSTIPPSQEVVLEREGAEVTFFEESLFDTTKVKFIRRLQPANLSDLYEVGSIYTPVNQAFKIKIRLNSFAVLPIEKYAIVRSIGKSKEALPTEISENWLTSYSDEFGDFTIQADTIAPSISRIASVSKISTVKKKKGKKKKKTVVVQLPLKAEGFIKFKITDALSGVNQINAWLDDEWVLLEPGAGANEWKFKFPENLAEGEHTFQIEAIDKSENSRFVQFCPEKTVTTLSP
jgi:hypothetical protein